MVTELQTNLRFLFSLSGPTRRVDVRTASEEQTTSDFLIYPGRSLQTLIQIVSTEFNRELEGARPLD